MGKKRHTQDKLWITRKEMVEDWGGKKEEESRTNPLKKLPFYCCSLSFTPFNDPVCINDGTIFDIINILPYIKKFKKNPITGLPLKVTDLIKLNFYKNQDGEYHCPVTYKVFTEHTVIIAIKETGNVYSYEAYEELNKKPKNFKDLLNNVEFDPKNIIYIQDPKNSNERLIQNFYFVKNNENIDFIKYGDDKFFENPDNFVNLSSTYKKLIEQYDETNVKENSRKVEILNMINNKPKIDDESVNKIKKEVENFEENVNKILSNLNEEENILINKIQDLSNFKKIFRISPLAFVFIQKKITPHEHARFSEGKTSTSFTSTTFDVNNMNKMRALTDDEIRITYFNTIKSKQTKGYVRLNTNFGSINMMLHCDLAPKTCENFIELCESGYYNNTKFHRLVKNFVLQGGDPTGTGKGGSSIYGRPFEDEFNPKLLHKQRGLLSMANSGKNTNGSQFFITFQPADYLDNKHTVFGEVVGGLKILDDIEKVGADEKERPKKEVKILNTEVFVNPYRDVISELLLKHTSEKYKSEKKTNEIEFEKKIENKLKIITNNKEELIGKYLNKKRNLSQFIGIQQQDPYLYEKPSGTRKQGEFDFTDW